MHTIYLRSKKSMYHLMLLSLGIGVLGGCSQSHQLGVVSTLSGEELLRAKLEDPNLVLNTTQSISLVEHCTQLGEQSAASALNKDAIAILGETGVGKSTCINHLIGCNMILGDPEVLGIRRRLEGVIVVSPDSAHPEATSIGHARVSHTFIPKIVQDPHEATRVYLDCPGFSDNRGAEINIANAVNTRRVLQQARGIKAILLANYSDFMGRDGFIMQFLENTCTQLFGGIENLQRHENSVLLGINRAPLQTSLDIMREECEQVGSPAMQILAGRLFLYDPLERGGVDFWSRAQFLAAIEQMPSIPQNAASSLFQTVLTDSDKTALQHIVRHQVKVLESTLNQSDYPSAGRCWSLLKRLRIIEHEETTALLQTQVIPHMRSYAAGRTAAFNAYAAQHDFAEAEHLLALLCSLNNHFPDENLVAMGGLNATLNTAKEQHAAQQAAEAEARRAEEEARRAEEARRVEAEKRRIAEEEARRAEEARQVEAEKRQRAEEQARRNGEAFERERSARERTEQRISNLESALEEEKRKNQNQIWGAVIGAVGHVAGQVVSKALDKG